MIVANALPQTPVEARRYLVDRVLAVAAERHINIDVAREIVHAETLQCGAELWALLGGQMIGWLFNEAVRKGRDHRSGEASPPYPSTTAAVENWRDQPHSPWDRIVAIGTTGEKKKCGDLTKDDLLVISTFYERQAKTMRQSAALYREAAGYVKEGQTLRQASRLPKRLLAFFEAIEVDRAA